MSTNRALGLTIARLRGAMEPAMSQQALGEAVGYQAGAAVSISRIENGHSRPGAARLAKIAAVLQTTSETLEEDAARLDETLQYDLGGPSSEGQPTRLGPKERRARVDRAVAERTEIAVRAAERFNAALDEADTEFLQPLRQTTEMIVDAPPIGHITALDDLVEPRRTGDVDESSSSATAAGSVFGSLGEVAAAAAARNLGRPAGVAMGSAGIAGSTMVVMGLVAAPAALWMFRQKKIRLSDLEAQVELAEGELAGSQLGFDAMILMMQGAAEVLGHVATHGTRAYQRWAMQIPESTAWASLTSAQREQHGALSEVADCQLAVATASLSFDLLLSLRGADLDDVIQGLRSRLEDARQRVELLV